MARRSSSTAVPSMTDDGGKSANGNTARSHNEQERQLLATLSEIGGGRVKDDAIIREGREFKIPETMSPTDALKFLRDHIKAQEAVNRFSRTFNYRPEDMAHAFAMAMRKAFGTMGIGQTIPPTFFSPEIPPEMRTIKLGPNGETTEVPWGEIKLDALEATIYTSGERHPDFGVVGSLIVDAPKKYAAHVQGLFQLVENELKVNSIYRGKAVTASAEPDFIDPWVIDRNEIVLHSDTAAQLDASVLTPINRTERLRELGRSLKLSALLEGPYGTGKTSILTIVAQHATANGWTAVHVRPGKDNLRDGMALARQYQPAVLLVEDVDKFASEKHDRDAVSELLDLFDGIQAKGTELLVLMTTNHADRIHKGMVRPGRLDSVIHVGVLDAPAVMELVRKNLPPGMLAELGTEDERQITDSMEGYLPAFVKETVERASRYSISRADGHDEIVTAEDLILAANGLRDQLALMEAAHEGEQQPTIDKAIGEAVKQAVSGVNVFESHYVQMVKDGSIRGDDVQPGFVLVDGKLGNGSSLS